MAGKSETGWIIAVVILLAIVVIGYFAWASTTDSEPVPVPADDAETLDTTPPAGSIDVDGSMDMTLPAPEEGEYEGIGEPPA